MPVEETEKEQTVFKISYVVCSHSGFSLLGGRKPNHGVPSIITRFPCRRFDDRGSVLFTEALLSASHLPPVTPQGDAETGWFSVTIFQYSPSKISVFLAVD